MTRKQLEKTKWAKTFLQECPSAYSQAIAMVLSPYLWVSIERRDFEDRADWVIIVGDSDPEFWLEISKTKKEAVALCKKMKWRLG